MPFSAKQFELDSEFERYVLTAVAPGVPPFKGHHALDWRSGRLQKHAHAMPAAITVTAQVGGKPAAVDMTPLVFSAAWKVLDLAVEQVHGQPAAGGHTNMQKRVNVALNGHGPQPQDPFKGQVDLWKRIMRIYGHTLDLRHTIIHRTNPRQGGQLVAVANPKQTRQPTSLTASDVHTFFRIVQAFSSALVAAHISPAALANLRFLVDQLQHVHDLGPIGGRAVTSLIYVLANLQESPGSHLTFDAKPILQDSLTRHPNAEIRVLLFAPTGEIFEGDLEAAPLDRPVEVRRGFPPKWLRKIDPADHHELEMLIDF